MNHNYSLQFITSIDKELYHNEAAIQCLTDKLRSLEMIENFYSKILKLLGQGVDIELPSDLDFDYHTELIKIRKQNISFVRWKLQLQSKHSAIKEK